MTHDKLQITCYLILSTVDSISTVQDALKIYNKSSSHRDGHQNVCPSFGQWQNTNVHDRLKIKGNGYSKK